MRRRGNLKKRLFGEADIGWMHVYHYTDKSVYRLTILHSNHLEIMSEVEKR